MKGRIQNSEVNPQVEDGDFTVCVMDNRPSLYNTHHILICRHRETCKFFKYPHLDCIVSFE